jgi:hypothetical protein
MRQIKKGFVCKRGKEEVINKKSICYIKGKIVLETSHTCPYVPGIPFTGAFTGTKVVRVIYTDAAYTSYHGLSCAVAALRVQLTGISFVYYLVYTIAEHDRWLAMYPTFLLDRVRAGVGAEAATG